MDLYVLITILASVTIPFQRMLWLKFLTSRQIMAPEATKSNKTPAIIIIISFLRIFNMQSWFPCSPMSSIYMYLYRSCSIRNLKLHSCCLPLSALVFFPDYLTIYTNFLDEGSFLFSKLYFHFIFKIWFAKLPLFSRLSCPSWLQALITKVSWLCS